MRCERSKPASTRHQIREALDQQPGADHERYRERHLADHERASHATARADRRRSTSRLAQREAEIAEAQMKRRRETEQNARADGDDQRERQHPAVDPDRRGARNARRSRGDEDLEPDPRQRDTRDRADDRQHETLGDELANQPAAPGAERGAQRKLLVPAFGADQQQVGEIRACDEQHEPHRRLKQPERTADAADDVTLQVVVAEAVLHRMRRVNESVAATLGRRLAVAAVEDVPLREHRLQIAARALGRDAVLEAADEREIVAASKLIAIRRIEDERSPQLHAFVVHVEPARHYADHSS